MDRVRNSDLRQSATVANGCLLAGLLFFSPGAHAQQAGADQAVRNVDQIDLSFQRDLRATVNEVVENRSTAAQLPGGEVSAGPRIARRNLGITPRGASSVDRSQPGPQAVNDQPTSSSVAVGEDSGITLNFQGADISALINMVSQVTGRNFIVDPRVKGKVTLVSGGSIPADDLYEIFLSVLEVHNFAAVQSGDVIKILPANLVKQRPTPTSYSGEPAESDAQITQIVTLDHAPVQELLPILRPLLPPTAHIAPHAGSNTLIITDTSSNVRRIMRLVHRMDKEQRSVDIRVIFMKHADAKKIGPVITQVGNSLRQAQGGKGRPPMQITVQVDEGLNALVLQAPEEDFPVLQALIDQLDVERPAGGDVHVVYLKYADAKEIETILNGLAEQKSTSAVAEGAPLASSAKIFIQSDETTNALIIRARQDDFDALKPVIEKLDIRRAQVFVETIIAEVAVNKESAIGVKWETNQRGSRGEQWSASTGYADTEGGLKIGFINELVENIVGDLVPDLGVVLSLLRSDSDVNVISTPNLLTLDNEEASIFVGQEVPFITGQFTTNVGSTTGVITGSTGATTGGNDSNTGTSGSTAVTGISNPFQTIERKDVGLTLKITPQINEGGAIRLEIEQEQSRISPTTVSGASDLITDNRTINATVQVDDGQIIVLGGLIRDDAQDTHEWVPVLGKIPVLGFFFRKKTKRTVKTNLMVFMRPKIIRTPQDLASLTRDRYEHIRTEQIESLPDTRRIINDKLPGLKQRTWENDGARNR